MNFIKFTHVILFVVISIPFKVNSQLSKQEKVQLALDSNRIKYEKVINKTCPSLSILIHTPNDYIFASSTAEGVAPLTKDTYFRFASNTKNFTSTSILKMQQDGWVNIKDKIVSNIPGTNIPYVPDTPEFDIPYKNEITIELLLQHAAGVYDVDNDSVPGFKGYSYTDYMDFYFPGHEFALSELVFQAAKNKLSYFPPGKGYHYSNTGYTILAEIIERVYSNKMGFRKYYADYIKDNITGITAPVPLDISFPYLANDLSLPEPNVKGTLWAKDSTAIFTKVNMSAHVGEGNGYATFVELDKFVRSNLRGENVLNPASIELMKNTVSDSNKTYALGCFYIKGLGYGHNGCIKGYLSYMMYDPDTDVSYIVMMPANDYHLPGEDGIVDGLKTLANAIFSTRMALGYSGRFIPY